MGGKGRVTEDKRRRRIAARSGGIILGKTSKGVRTCFSIIPFPLDSIPLKKLSEKF